MNTFRPKLWTAVGAAALLAACSPAGEAGDAGEKGEGGTAAPAAAPVGEAGETAGGEGGAGEAGAADAYRSVAPESRTALRLAHLRGFFLIAREVQKAGSADEAAALAGQGMLEVFDPARAIFVEAGVDEALLREAATKGDAVSLDRALANIDAARGKAGGDTAQVVAGLTGVAAGLYSGVVAEGAVDPIEYQHSYGAALSAKAEAERARNDPKIQAAKADLDAFYKLWPTVAAPEDAAKATPPGRVSAAASRIQLALS
ncbi:MAG TPA: hypothetical protein VEA15_04060 [Caulobacteraceae bacterium]|nr:hypothetical protein [Caulobacteraceae bacterium]